MTDEVTQFRKGFVVCSMCDRDASQTRIRYYAVDLVVIPSVGKTRDPVRCDECRAKIIYIPNFLSREVADAEFERLWNTLDWERREGAPRREYWQNNYDLPYTYGSGNGVRTYAAKPWDPFVREQMLRQNEEFAFNLDCCFLNGYKDERDSLGWHADDSPEMNPREPVTVISLGAERNISFRDYETKTIKTQRLGHGSLLIMPRGFQQTHQHKIPKGDRPCGPRISLTYRGMIV